MTRIAFITAQPLSVVDGEVVSAMASVRREILLPAKVLHRRGYEISLVSLPAMTPRHALSVIAGADHIVFGKIFERPQRDGAEPFSADVAEYRRVLSQLDRRAPISFCLSDDHFDYPAFSDFYRSVVPLNRAWIAPSPTIRARLEALSDRPVFVYPEPVETARDEARVPRRGLRERLGASLARRAKVGLDPWRLKLLWFGHPLNIGSLVRILPELEHMAGQVPLHLECVTQPGTELSDRVTPRGVAFSAPLRISFTPWSLETTREALEHCDVVLLPQLVDDPKKRAKSNNRLVDSLHAGRFVIAHPLPSYEELKEYAWVGDSISEGLRWLLRHPDEALSRLRAGQEYVAKHHSLEALADFWAKALELPEAPAPTKQQPFFVVYAKDWLQRSAGRRALHLLADALNRRGVEAFVSHCSVVNPRLRTPIIDASGIAALRAAGRPCVAIYPEVIHDDPYGADLAVRWLLNRPGLFRADFPGRYGERDLVFYWDREYQTLPVEAWPLKLPHVDAAVFNNDANPLDGRRTGRALFARKYLDAGHAIEPELLEGSIDISLRPPEYRSIPPEELAKVFRAARYLVTYEPSSVTLEAQLCGCPVVYRLSEYMPEAPDLFGSAGATISLADEDIERARATLPQVREAYEAQSATAEKQIDMLIELCRSRLEKP